MAKKRNHQTDAEASESPATGNAVDETEHRGLLPPSPNAATNLLIADIVVRGASTLFRKNVEKRVAQSTTHNQDEAQQLLDGRGIIRTLGLYGASKLATKSPLGLGVVAGGLALKTLYDRGKARQKRRKSERKAAPRAKSED